MWFFLELDVDKSDIFKSQKKWKFVLWAVVERMRMHRRADTGSPWPHEVFIHS